MRRMRLAERREREGELRDADLGGQRVEVSGRHDELGPEDRRLVARRRLPEVRDGRREVLLLATERRVNAPVRRAAQHLAPLVEPPGHLAERARVRRPGARRLPVAERAQLRRRVIADADVEREAPVGLGMEQRLVAQRRQELHRVRLAHHALRRFHREAPREHRAAREGELLAVRQEPPRPLDRVRQRRVPAVRAARGLREHAVTSRETLGELGERQEPRPRGGELDGERDALEAPDDLGERPRIVGERAAHVAGALQEQEDGGRGRNRLLVAVAGRALERRKLHHDLAAEAQPLARGDQHHQPRRRLAPARDGLRRGHDLLEVVEHEQRGPRLFEELLHAQRGVVLGQRLSLEPTAEQGEHGEPELALASSPGRDRRTRPHRLARTLGRGARYTRATCASCRSRAAR